MGKSVKMARLSARGRWSVVMSDRPREDPIAMERRHIREGENRVARQEALLLEIRRNGHSQLARQGTELLDLLRECLAMSRERLRALEQIASANRPYQAESVSRAFS